MRRRKIIVWMFIALMIVAMFNFAPQTAQANTSNFIGGHAVKGCLKVSVVNGDIYIERYDGSVWKQQYYAPSDTVLNVDGILYETGTYYGSWRNSSSFSGDRISVATQTVDNNSIITTWQKGQLRIKQTITLPSLTAQYIKMVWSIQNAGNTSLNNLHFLRGEDTYLAGGDNGSGYWDAATKSVGVYKTVSGILQRLYLQGITTPSSYTSQNYSNAYVEVRNGIALSNTIDDNANTDNGYAMEWKKNTLYAGDIWTIRAIESFSSSSVTGGSSSNAVVSTDSVGTITMPFTVTNSSNTPQDVTYSVEGPEGWTVIPERISETIGANESTTINVQVTPPDDVDNGDYEIVLNMGTTSGTSQGVGIVTIARTPQAPTIGMNDVQNILIGVDNTMEYSVDEGNTWISYNVITPAVFDGDVTVQVRVKADSGIPAGEITTVYFTENPQLTAAPVVTIDDINNEINGLDSSMEYSTDGGMIWTVYNSENEPVFNGDITVQLRKKTGETVTIDYSVKSVSGSAISVESGSVISEVSGTATSVVSGSALTADFTNNKLGKTDATMEYSTDEGSTWHDVQNSILDFDGDTRVLIRKKAGEIATVTFTKNPQAAPEVTVDDVNNKLIGLDDSMEYSTDGGITWTAYNSGNEPVFSGDVVALIRKKETPDYASGAVTSVRFTENPQLPEAPEVTINNNEINGLDSSMEYSTDGGTTWTAYSSENKPVFSGDVTVQLRKKAGEAVIIDYSVKSVSGSAISVVSGSVISVVSGSAISVVSGSALTTDFTNNRLGGTDATMEYSMDEGNTWHDVQNSILDFDGDTRVLIRKKAGEIATIIFTKNPQAAPAVTVDDVNNKLIGLDDSMEYSTDGGMTWTAYNSGNEPVFSGDVTVLIRKKETPDYASGAVTSVRFTENSQLPEAPEVTINDNDNEINGLDSSMEYSTDGGTTWTAYNSENEPVFSGDVTVQLRKKAGEAVIIDYSVKSVSGSAISVVSGSVISAVSGSAISVVSGSALTADFTNNKLGGTDATMEYSTDEGSTWHDIQNSILDFDGDTRVLLRKKAGEITTVTFTKYLQAEPQVVIDDENNVISGLDNTMEYSTDGGITWIAYNSDNEPVFNGNITVLVRKKETSDYRAGNITTLNFTSNSPAAPAITINDNSNYIVGADATMEYSIDGGDNWIDYDISNKPRFFGNVTVQIRTKASAGTPAGEITTVNFTQNTYIPKTSESGNEQEVRQINLNRGNEKDISTVATVNIIRTISDGKKIDSVILKKEKTKEALDKKEDSEYVQLVIDDIPDDKSDEINVTIDKASVEELAGNTSAFEIKTDDVSVRLPVETISALAKENKNLYFRFIPIKDEEEQKEVKEKTITAEIVQQAAGNNEVNVLGTPMTIETNYSDFTTTLLFSLKNIEIPEDEEARREFLDGLSVYIQHSDGDQEINKGTIIYDENGVPIGLEIKINKFSLFTMITISNHAPVAKQVSISGEAVVGKKLKAIYTYFDEDGDVQGDSFIKWYRADKKDGENKTLIEGADTAVYKVRKEDQNKYLIVEITPIAKTGRITGEVRTVFIKAAYNEAPTVKYIKIKGNMKIGAILTANYTYMDAEKDAEGNSVYQWFRSDTADSKKQETIKGVNKLTYALTEEDLDKYITFQVMPIAKTGIKNGQKSSYTLKENVKADYGCHVRLGLIGSGLYANEVADIYNRDYDVSNVRVEQEGNYYRVYMDFTSKKAARVACKDMIAREYIINYYFIN